MNAKERFLEILNFNTGIRTLDWEFGYWGGALNRWYDEGLIKIEGLEREVTYGEGVCGPRECYGSGLGGDLGRGAGTGSGGHLRQLLHLRQID